MKGRILFRRLIGLFQRQHQRHQGLGDKAAAIGAEMAGARRDRCAEEVGNVWFMRSACSRAGVWAAWMKSTDARGVLDAGRAFHAGGNIHHAWRRDNSMARATLSGVEPARQEPGLGEAAAAENFPVERRAMAARALGALWAAGHRTSACRRHVHIPPRRPGRRPRATGQRLDDGHAELAADISRAPRAFAAMQLEEIRAAPRSPSASIPASSISTISATIFSRPRMRSAKTAPAPVSGCAAIWDETPARHRSRRRRPPHRRRPALVMPANFDRNGHGLGLYGPLDPMEIKQTAA